MVCRNLVLLLLTQVVFTQVVPYPNPAISYTNLVDTVKQSTFLIDSLTDSLRELGWEYVFPNDTGFKFIGQHACFSVDANEPRVFKNTDGKSCLLTTKKKYSRYMLRAQIRHFDEVDGVLQDVDVNGATWTSNNSGILYHIYSERTCNENSFLAPSMEFQGKVTDFGTLIIVWHVGSSLNVHLPAGNDTLIRFGVTENKCGGSNLGTSGGPNPGIHSVRPFGKPGKHFYVPNRWNVMELRSYSKDSAIHFVNGSRLFKIVNFQDLNNDQYTLPNGEIRGNFGFQGEGAPVFFRNMIVNELNENNEPLCGSHEGSGRDWSPILGRCVDESVCQSAGLSWVPDMKQCVDLCGSHEGSGRDWSPILGRCVDKSACQSAGLSWVPIIKQCVESMLDTTEHNITSVSSQEYFGNLEIVQNAQKFTVNFGHPFKLKVFNIHGDLLQVHKVNSNQSFKISQKGVYYFKIESDQYSQVKKVNVL